MSYDVFIGHDRGDRAVADAARAAIERAGHICWIAPRDVRPGQDDNEAAAQGISDSRVFLPILSSRSAGSEEVRRAVERAAAAGLAAVAVAAAFRSAP